MHIGRFLTFSGVFTFRGATTIVLTLCPENSFKNYWQFDISTFKKKRFMFPLAFDHMQVKFQSTFLWLKFSLTYGHVGLKIFPLTVLINLIN